MGHAGDDELFEILEEAFEGLAFEGRLFGKAGADLARRGLGDDGQGGDGLEIVGHPVAVNPDRTLESIAYHRGWPIVEFSRTRKKVVKRTTAASGAIVIAAATYALGRRHGRLANGRR